jgi:S-formylglutathione hydrolase FrmB
MVLAMPSDGLYGIGSGYLQRAGENAERWIVQEVPEATKLAFPSADLSNVSIAGLSMGGWGALRLAARHPGRYRAAVGISPLTRLAQIAAYAPQRLRSKHAPHVAYPELAELLSNGRAQLPPLRISCGVDDPLIQDVQVLHKRLLNSGVEHQYAEVLGGHTWDCWAAEIYEALVFVNASQTHPLNRSFTAGSE